MIQYLSSKISIITEMMPGGVNNIIALIVKDTIYDIYEVLTPWLEPLDMGLIIDIIINSTTANRKQLNN